MKYCSRYDPTTHLSSWTFDTGTYCQDCGTELTPEIRCRCGEISFNPMSTHPPKFCTACGRKWTEAYLAECMSVQLKGLVNQITEKHSALP